VPYMKSRQMQSMRSRVLWITITVDVAFHSRQRRCSQMIVCNQQCTNVFQGLPIVDGFRRGLGAAIQWLDCLRVLVDRRVEERLQSAWDRAKQRLQWNSTDLNSDGHLQTPSTSGVQESGAMTVDSVVDRVIDEGVNQAAFAIETTNTAFDNSFDDKRQENDLPAPVTDGHSLSITGGGDNQVSDHDMMVDNAVDEIVDEGVNQAAVNVSVNGVVNTTFNNPSDSRRDGDLSAPGSDRHILSATGEDDSDSVSDMTVDSTVANQFFDGGVNQGAVDVSVNGEVNTTFGNSSEDSAQKDALPAPEIERLTSIPSPWEKPFRALTDFEQAMHKLYGKYGAECDERLQRPTFGLCSRYLQKLCPACFGGTVFGKDETRYIPLVHRNCSN
jgi:hypothetical protein